MQMLRPFQTTLETLRSHHWRYYTDPYMGCEFDCMYCLYRGSGSYAANVAVKPGAVKGILSDLASAPTGILDIGAVSDAYQPAEKRHRVTRRLLRALADRGQPTFIGTKSTLVAGDLDTLRHMAKEGLVEVNFSLVSLSEEFTRQIEPGAPSPQARLDTAKMLADAGIPVSFHLAPVVPGLLSEPDIYALIRRVREAGGRHIFACILGGRKSYWDQLVEALARLGPSDFYDWSAFTSLYGPKESFDDHRRAQPSEYEYLTRIMKSIMVSCQELGVGFVCENIPDFTTVDLVGGIYRWKLPTVYDMAKYVASAREPVNFERFCSAYWFAFNPPKDLIDFVSAMWKAHILFTNTRLRPKLVSGELLYATTDDFEVSWGGVMTVAAGIKTAQ